jgi:hypothetical protein
MNAKPHIYKQGKVWMAVKYQPYKHTMATTQITDKLALLILRKRWQQAFGKDELSQITSSP